MSLKSTSLLLLTMGLVGCAFNRPPIVDMVGVDVAAWQRDLQECEAYADQVQVAAQAGSGAAAGAVVGAAVGAVIGNSSTAARGAGVGAVSGATSGTSRGLAERRQVIRNCLLGRGYRVLN